MANLPNKPKEFEAFHAVCQRIKTNREDYTQDRSQAELQQLNTERKERTQQSQAQNQPNCHLTSQYHHQRSMQVKTERNTIIQRSEILRRKCQAQGEQLQAKIYECQQRLEKHLENFARWQAALDASQDEHKEERTTGLETAKGKLEAAQAEILRLSCLAAAAFEAMGVAAAVEAECTSPPAALAESESPFVGASTMPSAMAGLQIQPQPLSGTSTDQAKDKFKLSPGANGREKD